MKGSAVAHGLKSLAAKIHPQLPLTTRESQQLLTALTSSFRQHLDQAHPTVTNGDGVENPESGSASTSRTDAFPSSTACTDKHLASILTSPLLSRDRKEDGPEGWDMVAKAELLEEYANDPVRLLEDYQSRGIATLSNAELCLESLKTSMATMAPNERLEKARETKAGQRVYTWLQQNDLFKSLVTIDKSRFINLMVYFLVCERDEDLLWEWLTLDLAQPKSKVDNSAQSNTKLMLEKYRWRGRLIHSMVRMKLGLLDSKHARVETPSLNAALDDFFQACDIRQSVEPRNHLHWIPLGLAGSELHKTLTNSPTQLSDVDEPRYNRFMKLLHVRMDGAPPAYINLNLAELQLYHPRSPSSELAYHTLQSLLSGDPPISMQNFLLKIRSGKNNAESNRWYLFMVRTVCLLQEQSLPSEATWTLSKIFEEFPNQACRVEDDMRQILEQRSKRRGVQQEHVNTLHKAHVHMPFPAFG